MIDYWEAGGVPAVEHEISSILFSDTMTVDGEEKGALLARNVKTTRPEVIKTLRDPVRKESGIAVLTGNLSPLGCVVKPAAVPENLMFLKAKQSPLIVRKNLLMQL